MANVFKIKKQILAKSFYSLALIIFLISCEGCDDNPKTELEKLPPATQTGKNTFGCLVNGKAWVTEISTAAGAFYQEGVLSMSGSLGRNYVNPDIYIYIYI